MTHSTIDSPIILRELGDGLILRRSTPADAEALAEFNGRIHSDAGPEQPNATVAAWTRDLLNGNHPTFGVDDFTIVEDTRAGRIVSSLNLISQTWAYDGIAFGIGRPELVGTDPNYRNRGLVRAQMEVVHQWSAERGQLLQAITGIPWYYRQFGYEMGLALGGGRIGYSPHVPKLKDGVSEPYRVRRATPADVPFVAQVYEQAARRYRVVCLRDETLWRYEMFGKSGANVNRDVMNIVETAAGEPVGFVAHKAQLWGAMLTALAYELKPGVSWLAVTPSVIRCLWSVGEEYAARDDRKAFDSFAFWLGEDHPAYHACPDLMPNVRKPYAYYVRVPDLPAFIRRITPALEARLAGSILAGHTGELKISFYRSGLRLTFERGGLARVDDWPPTPDDRGAAAFPDLTFLQLLFGYRGFEDLEYAFADCWAAHDEARALLTTLFPRQVSAVWPVA